MEVFKFDGHFHAYIPTLERTLSIGLSRGMHGLFPTCYRSTEAFDALAQNTYQGKRVLDPKYWDVKKTDDPRVLRVDHSNSGPLQTICIGKAQEVQSSEGDVLGWGIHKTIQPGQDIQTTVHEIIAQEGIAVLAHPCANLFGGCGVKKLAELAKRFEGEPLALELNAQYPRFPIATLDFNAQAQEFAEKHHITLFFNSDTHPYLNHNDKFGESLNNAVQSNICNHIFGSLSTIAKRNLQILVKPEGSFNTFKETASWWFAPSPEKIKRSKGQKLLDAARHMIRGLRR